MRQVTAQKPQRSTVSTETRPLSLRKPDRKSDRGPREPQEPKTYPATALGLMLLFGILLGLLFAAVISSFVDGGSSGSSKASPKPSTSGGIASQQDEDRRTQERTDEIHAAAAPESRDVSIRACGVDQDGFASARVLITNSTNERSTYYVRVIFLAASDGRIISDDVASVKRLPPGRTAPLQTVQALEAVSGDSVNCRLGGVTRF